MKNTVEYLQELIDTREQMKTSINNKGVQVSGGLKSYPNAIDNIFVGGGGDGEIDYTMFGWSQNDSNRQNQINKKHVEDAIQYSLSVMDKCDASKWDDNSDPPFRYDDTLVFCPMIYNLKRGAALFAKCFSLRSIPLIDTQNVTNMNSMFLACYNLTYFPPMDTSNVTNMNGMFQSCSSLISVSQMDTSNVTDMNCMFNSCTSLTSVPQLNTSNVEDMGFMFSNCSQLTSIPQLDASKLGGTASMFTNCYSLKDFGGLKNLSQSIDLRYCPELTHESLMNVINGLADVRYYIRNVTISSSSHAKLTNEEIKIATDKGWTISIG